MSAHAIATAPALAPASTPSPRFYNCAQTAQAVGLSTDRFRKVRHDWTRDRDFPSEVNEPGEPIRYMAVAVDRWVERRSRRVQPVAERMAAPDTATMARPEDRQAAVSGRAQLRLIRGMGAC